MKSLREICGEETIFFDNDKFLAADGSCLWASPLCNDFQGVQIISQSLFGIFADILLQGSMLIMSLRICFLTFLTAQGAPIGLLPDLFRCGHDFPEQPIGVFNIAERR